ncbi:hypothetical protein HK098_000210 [Nowakowskiella sp. JEL0407]|nr:hypothetical protein HK098_000210 [Nowakowskiella sp. JEL0407]
MQQFAPWFNQIPFNADPAAANLFLSTIFAAIIGNNAQSQISAGTQKSTTKGTRKRKNLSPEEKEERLKERVLRNRAAAQESRDKKRKQMEDLESQNKILTKQNADLTQRLMALETMNRTLMSKVDGIANKIAELPITPPSQRSSVDNDVALLNRTKYSGSPTTDFSLSPHADSAAVDVSRIIRPLKKPIPAADVVIDEVRSGKLKDFEQPKEQIASFNEQGSSQNQTLANPTTTNIFGTANEYLNGYFNFSAISSYAGRVGDNGNSSIDDVLDFQFSKDSFLPADSQLQLFVEMEPWLDFQRQSL